MSHYAKVLNNVVIQIIVAEEDFFKNFIDSSPGDWIQTSYNTKCNIHYGNDGSPDNGIPLRGNYAGIGYIYDSINDVFYPPKPYESWILSHENWSWNPPVIYPSDGKNYQWNESIKTWDLIE